MTETTNTKAPKADWELIERDYRLGVKSLREIAKEHGITHAAIAKKAKQFSWVRDLSEKVQAAAKDKVTKALVSKAVTAETTLKDTQSTEVMADVVSRVDLQNRDDLSAVLDVQRNLAQELASLSRPEFSEQLEKLGEIMDESYTTDSGREVKDKVNELYRYIISLAGRVKMAKDIASAYGVYIPVQRKVWGLDEEKQKTSEIDELLKRVRQEMPK